MAKLKPKLGTVATTIVDKIVEDIRDRRGLKHEWNAIDGDVRREIRRAWREIIATTILEAMA